MKSLKNELIPITTSILFIASTKITKPAMKSIIGKTALGPDILMNAPTDGKASALRA